MDITDALIAQCMEILPSGLMAAVLGTTGRCPTGEPYFALTAGGIKPEGYDFPCWHKTRHDAIAAYLASFAEYAKNTNEDACLYWREYPSVVHEDGKWQVYSRLVIA